ncbi:MAG: hypothetical protein GX272_08895 [Epulopiscium sp.]|nr:hypothetical protein [Candidatus Epulonipiscium sp.]
MINDIKSVLRFTNYKVDKIEFKLNPNYKNEKIDIDLNIKKQVMFDENEKVWNVKLITKVFEDATENNYPFSLEIELTGIFEVDTEDDNNTEKLLNINAVAILFPYVRSLISTYTANANVQPLILPAINVNKLIDMSKKEQ